MKILDLFCGAGLASDGYANLEMSPYGVDINSQPNYPYNFFKADALEVLNSSMPEDFDFIHASPPCQLFSRAARLRDAQRGQSKYGDFLTPVIDLLRTKWNHKIWVIENVEGAKSFMPDAVRVCGSSFGLDIQRHRLFMSNVSISGTICNHKAFPIDPISNKPRPWGIYHVPSDEIPKGGRTALSSSHAAELMGLHRQEPLSWQEIKEGIPPLYTSYIGSQLIHQKLEQ